MQLNEAAADPSPPPVYGPFAPGQGPNGPVQGPYAPGYGPPFAPCTPSLASTPAQKKAAAEAIRTRIRPGTKKDGDHADEETAAAVKAFGAKDGDGWVTSRALKNAHKTWGEQVQAMLKRLEADENGLNGARLNLRGADLTTQQQFRSISPLDGY
ncbi:hypothetical protein LT966_23310 [Streptomyces griseobrunneus]|uniref:hypothetical protein n=1 Tax=Streptomyces sp. 196(2019) TaxID=2683820 RepID=UPI0013EAC5A3|nr:hypothetical protein [Streptomyces sp. 196(2019)]NGO87325.1 hypothetical protein [Streptomyces sp. 196(2019)]